MRGPNPAGGECRSTPAHPMQTTLTIVPMRPGTVKEVMYDPLPPPEPLEVLEVLDAALSLRCIGYSAGNGRKADAPAAHHVTHRRRQRSQLPGQAALGLSVAFSKCLAYGTIASDVVAHRVGPELW